MVKTIKPRVSIVRLGVRCLPKTADAELRTSSHRAWADSVKQRAGYRCEQCGRQGVTLYADHVHERRDGGSLTGEGRALCGSCHGRKTAKARRERMMGGA